MGSPGRCHGVHLYGRSRLRELVESDHFRSPVSLIEGTAVAPVILCDQMFALAPNLLKPFSNVAGDTREAAFNYNLSKTRKIVENAFGRLKARFRFIMKRLEYTLSNAKEAIKTSCILHNTCVALNDNIEPQWENEVHRFDTPYGLPSHNTNICSRGRQEIRAPLTENFFKQAQQTS